MRLRHIDRRNAGPRDALPVTHDHLGYATEGLIMNDDIDEEKISVVVLSALSVELRAIQPHLTSARTVRHRAGTHFVVGKVGDRRRWTAATVTGEGNHAAAIIAERAITLFRPKALVFVGIAGSL